MTRKLSLIVLSLTLTLSFCVTAEAKKPQRNVSSVKKEQRAAAKAIKLTAEQIEANNRKTSRTLNELNSLSADIAEHEKSIASLSAQVNTLNGEINRLNDSIAILEGRLNSMRDSYARSVKRINAAREGSMSKLAFIFSSDSFFQAYRRMRYLREFSKWRDRKSGEISAATASLEASREEMSKLKARQSESLAALSASQRRLEEKRKSTSALVDELKKENSSLRQVLRRKEEEARSLDAELDRLIAEEQRKREEEEQRRLAEERRKEEEKRRIAEEKRLEEQRLLAQQQKENQAKAAADKAKKDDKKSKEQKKKKSDKKQSQQAPQSTANEKLLADNKPAPVVSKPAPSPALSKAEESRQLSGSFESNKGNLLFPVTGRYRIVRPFGRQQHPDLPHVTTDNSGIDIEVAPGGNARAVFAGTVSAIFRQPGFNTIVMVRHGAYLTIYANLSDLLVKNGDQLKAGQTIGRIYSDPEDGNRSTLHFELRREKEKLNPAAWVK